MSSGRTRVQVFGYKIIKTEPLSMLEEYQEHRRLRVFFHKGVECINPKCNKVGTMIVHGMDRGGNVHVDICDDDFYPLSVDHRLPRSKGGSDELENLDPMCTGCNTKKGNGDPPMKKEPKIHITEDGFKRVYEINPGDEVYKKTTHKLLGVVSELKTNHRHPRRILAAAIIGKGKESLYDLKALYKLERV